MIERLLPELAGPATPVRFPEIARDELANGLRVWTVPWNAVPVAAVALVLPHGAAQDPAAAPGLAGLTADLVDEAAGGRDALQLADAFARLGTHLDIEVGQESTVLSFTTLARFLDPALALLADVLARPHLLDADLARIRQLRLNRLRQLRTSASAAADRAFLSGVFGAHPYGHGTLGTTRALEQA
jgi:predicted Zn-dependent peptidase